MIKHAIILAAGLGKRMLPLTNELPKPMLQIRGKPIIKHLIDLLDQIGIEKICVNVHYKSELFSDYLQSIQNKKILISDETNELLDTGGGIKKAFDLLEEENSFVFNSDILWNDIHAEQLKNMSEKFNTQDMDAFLGLSHINKLEGYDGLGDFCFTDSQIIERYKQGNENPYVYSGVQILKKHLLNSISDSVFSINKAWDIAIKSNTLYGFKLEHQIMHIGTPEMVERVNDDKN
jgi:MurNAc alpha-1-phosphate uridylyltransferase